MTLFVDSGVAYAQRHEESNRHGEATAAMARALSGAFGTPLTSDYVVDEAFTLVRSRTGRYEPGRDLLAWFLGRDEYPSVFELLEVDQRTFDAALDILETYDDHDLSFTDATTVALVEERGIDHVLSFDDDFDGIVDRLDPADVADGG